jgi:hypothetical protein
MSRKSEKNKQGGGDADLDLIEQTLKNICAKINLDLKNKVADFENFCMTNPDDKKNAASLKLTRENVNNLSFYEDVYPQDVMD